MTFDWILPTNPIGAIVFGVLITIGFAYATYRETKSVNKAVLTLSSGIFTTLLVMLILRSLGYIN